MTGIYSDSAAFVARIDALEKELSELREEEADTGELVARQGDILRATADALHGGPLADGWWSHHDLAEIAAKMRAALLTLIARSEAVCLSLSHTVGGDDEVTDPVTEEVKAWLEAL
jgi:hypothetical protein